MRRDLAFYIFGGLTGLVVGFFLAMSIAKAAIECAARPDLRTPGPFWRYRVIDGAPCWYRSETALPKSALQWERQPESPPIEEAQDEAPLRPLLVQTISYRASDQDDRPVGLLLALVTVLGGFVGAVAVMLWPVLRSPRG